jgi:hypothetical protein
MAHEPFRIQVEDLGRIAAADVTVKPFTLFVGENNSGKSWLATAIWAFHQGTLPMPDESHPAWRSAMAHAADLLTRAHAAGGEVPIDGAWDAWATSLSPSIAASAMALAMRGPVASARIVIPGVPVSGSIVRKGDRELSITSSRLHVLTSQVARDQHAALAQHLVGAALVPNTGLNPSMATVLFGHPGPYAVVLPASRTGFVQLLPSVIDVLLTGRQDGFPGIPGPVLQFLRTMANPLGAGRGHPDLADQLERSTLAGRVRRADSGVGRFEFVPDGSRVVLPMGRSSAIVTELAPLITLLREHGIPKLLIYEEPEAHLHPRLQRVVAQVLVRLVRRGTNVLVTTHSATFAQQVNSFIKLGALGFDDARRADMADALGLVEPYTPEDRLLPDEVAAYGFRFRDDGRTVVDALEVRDEGVVMPSFNDEAVRMRAEYQWLNERLDER